jgi:hypothetical protein
VEEARRRRWYADGYAPGHETLVERRIRLAQQRGDFDDLPGRGKPLPLEGPDDENWWVRGYLRREGLSAEPLLPTPLQLRREVERLPGTVAELRDEAAVRQVVRGLNRRIAEWLRAPVGPAVPVAPVDTDAVVARWRTDRAALLERRVAERRAADAAAVPPRRRWWQRRARRGAAPPAQPPSRISHGDP